MRAVLFAAAVLPAAAFRPSSLLLKRAGAPFSMSMSGGVGGGSAEDEVNVKAALADTIGAMGLAAVSGDPVKIGAWIQAYCADDGFFIRPSGNPLPFTGACVWARWPAGRWALAPTTSYLAT